MKLSVIIVNYNVRLFLEQCLDSLSRALQGIESEVIVIDNASTDGSEDYIRPLYPDVKFVYNYDNKGFARANNQGIRMSSGEYVLVLNPDTIVAEGTIRKCLDFMDSHPDAGAAGVCMYTGDGSFLAESKRGFPTPVASLWKLTGLSALFPMSRTFGSYSLRYLSKDSVHHVDVLSGAFLIFKRKVSDICGLLDEDFFMYGEDIDFSYRLETGGYINYYLPYHIIHYKGESTKKNSYKYVRTFYDAMLIFFRKHYGGTNRLLYSFIRFGIYVRGAIAMLPNTLKKIKALVVPAPACEPVRVYTAVGKTDFSAEVKEVLAANGVEAEVRYAPLSALPGVMRNEARADYVVFNRQEMSYDDMIHAISASPGRILFGTFSPVRKTLITPDKQYCMK